MTAPTTVPHPAAAAFVEAQYLGVYRYFVWLTRDADQAADLTQETFAAFWASGGTRLLPETEWRAWLYGIARNRWRKQRRDTHPAAAPLDGFDAQDSAPGPEDCLLRALDWEQVSAAVAALPPDYREALVLRVWAELEYAEIAAALRISEGLARWRVHRARGRLKNLLGGEK